jgi:hypothetical protein
MDIENYTGITVDEGGGFHRFVCVANSFGIVTTGDTIRKTSGVDSLYLSKFE